MNVKLVPLEASMSRSCPWAAGRVRRIAARRMRSSRQNVRFWGVVRAYAQVCCGVRPLTTRSGVGEPGGLA
jgi:hypothetical protein